MPKYLYLHCLLSIQYSLSLSLSHSIHTYEHTRTWKLNTLKPNTLKLTIYTPSFQLAISNMTIKEKDCLGT